MISENPRKISRLSNMGDINTPVMYRPPSAETDAIEVDSCGWIMFLLQLRNRSRSTASLSFPGAAAIATLGWTRYRQAFGGQPSKSPSSSGRRAIIAPARSCSLPCVRSRNGVPTSTCRSCLKAISSFTARSSGCFSEPAQSCPEGARSCVASHRSSWPLPYVPVCLIPDKRWSTPH